MHLARRQNWAQLAAIALLVLTASYALLMSGRPAPAALTGEVGSRTRDTTDRQGITRTEELIWSLQQRAQRAPDDLDVRALLGSAYLQRARETGDPTFYSKAEAVLDAVTRRDPQHIEALIGQGALALARHDFRAALEIGEKARAIDGSIARIYGVIGDAQVELGMYDAAVQTIQTMIDLRPDLGSYSRVSYLRELYGDLPGAIEAMQQAIAAGGPTIEHTLWTQVQLGNLYFNSGKLADAEQQYQRALARLPDYAPAQAGLARVRAANGEYAAAIELLTGVTARLPLPEYVILLGDVYAAQGDQQAAQRQYSLVAAIDQLLESNGVNTDLETALFNADHQIDLAETLNRAQAVYAARPSIHAADVLAWTLYQSGRYAEAQQYSNEALKLGTKDALKLFHAGMIARALGQDAQAQKYLQQALTINPYFSLLYADQARTTLAQLQARQGGS